LICVSVFAFAQTPGYDLNSIIVTTGTENPIANIDPITDDKQPADSTLDIVTWNLSFFGVPSYSSKFEDYTRDEQIDSVAKKIIDIDADVYALQEVVVDSNNGNALDDLLSKINELAGDGTYGGSYSPNNNGESDDFPSQCLAYIWKKSTVSVNSDSTLLQDEASYSDFGYGRLPYMLDANVTFRGKTQRYFFINIHLKASTGYDDMRASSMELLRSLLEINFYEQNVVLLGDYNVADDPGALGEIQDWGMYEDREGDGLTDFVHVAGDKEEGIDHILISNELYDELAYINGEYDWNVIIDNTKLYSDHAARMTSLYVYEESGDVDPDSNSVSHGDYSMTMIESDYQLIVDYSNTNGLNTKTEYTETGENYYGASSYFSNFDTEEDGSWNQSAFTSWDEAVKTALSLIVLPEIYADAEAGSQVYKVTFTYYNGSTSGDETFNFECTKSAPDPEFTFTTNTSSPVYEVSTLKLFPNPVDNQLTISSDISVSSYSIFNSNGQLVANSNVLGLVEVSINLTDLKQGIYLMKIENENGKFETARFLKQ
jgi:endonuclease/exonuclease/phosphatase family metal-dependent hydrolase